MLFYLGKNKHPYNNGQRVNQLYSTVFKYNIQIWIYIILKIFLMLS